MTTKNMQKDRYFCIFNYYLNGVFLKWEEVTTQSCPVLIPGQDWVVNLEDGTQITAKIVETEDISEDERRIYLRSCTSAEKSPLRLVGQTGREDPFDSSSFSTIWCL